MTKAQLIEQMAKDTSISKAQADKVLTSLLDSIQQAMKPKDGQVTLPGFGKFSKVYRKARNGVNPSTGERITIKARHAIKFQAAKALKDAIS